MTTRIEAANAREAEAREAWKKGDYAAAARDFTLAAEQLEAIWHEMHGARGASPDAGNMRREARAAIIRRDAPDGRKAAAKLLGDDHPRIKLQGKIGGWQ